MRHRPETLGQASRIPGITPAAVTLLHMLLEHGKMPVVLDPGNTV